jgi:uncharacterized protein DUF2752
MSVALSAPSRSRSGPWVTWAASGALGAGTFAALGTTLASRLPGSVCVFRELTHMGCPTCGLTRSLTRLAHGDLAGSLAVHPWGLVLVVQAIVAWAVWGLWLGGRLRERPDRLLPRAFLVHALALVALWAVRAATGTLPPVH